ncbi:hypothetical protein [Bacillus toyonensis]|uniref:hypothetical protein n=1 Tax=Bacillus toyonensis TaxID=155322 RepID=UPI000BF02802|nr:hypothetical protein [Bacillus toyonensis]PEJ98796.1 hypothetical protein CN688_05520 [Bacillus toyonensis]PEK75625.1 hypothetical protein CN594_30135 [Bacillus toyonensis]PEL24684.1 hypothetical protein CN624_17840 [Bacillus toyonensis]PEO51524.1 hypothetical protein CN579_27615 [Bacillus toyonensis]PFY35449.1 hypothetical protein COL54_29250 [Bacillus toyonensis]
MTKIKLNVLFKKMQKDDKKEVLKFHVVSDELPHAVELLRMPGTIVHLTVEESEIEPIGAEFVNIQRDSKKTVIDLHIKGDTRDKINQLYSFAGENVSIILEPSQMSIDEFYEEQHEGMEYNIKQDGTTEINPGQLKLIEGESVAE